MCSKNASRIRAGSIEWAESVAFAGVGLQQASAGKEGAINVLWAEHFAFVTNARRTDRTSGCHGESGVNACVLRGRYKEGKP